jgi:mannosyl-3-phosphoglycerate phosphatase
MSRLPPEVVIFSDLDGTFLDHHTYGFDDALPAFRNCLAANVPVVFCSSKTRAEMELIRQALGSADPFIPESGGAVFIPRGYFPFPIGSHAGRDRYCLILLGAPYAELTSALDNLSHELGIPIRAFHHMTPRQIAAETGLSAEEAQLAAAREYDEPFLLPNANTAEIGRFLETAEARGLRCTEGGRFHHLLGHAGKQPAVDILTVLYRRWNPEVVTAGLGDSANDTGMLAAVDIPILVQKPGGAYDPAVARALPAVRRSPLPGPRGWNASVQSLLANPGRGRRFRLPST